MRKFLGALLLLLASYYSMAQKNTLDYFFKQAEQNSPLLKDFQAQLLALSLDSQILRATMRPQVNGISNNSYAPVIGGWGYDEVITNGQQLSGLFQVTKSFFADKTIASQLAALRIQGLQAGNNSKITLQDLRKTIADQYITTYGEQLQLDFNYHINGILKKEDSLLKKLTQDNVYRQVDYLSFAVTLQQQLLNTSQLEIQYGFDYGTLNWVAGIVDSTVVTLADPQLSLATLGDFYSSPFYRQFELDSLKLVNDRELIDLTYRPKISAFADAGYNSSLSIKPYKNFGASAGINITVPIYDGHQKKLQYAKIDIEERTRATKRDFFMAQRNQQVLILLRQLNATDRLIDQVNKQITYTETLITVNEQLLATGDIKLTDFILSLNNYFTAKNLVRQNYVNRLKIISQLNYWAK